MNAENRPAATSLPRSRRICFRRRIWWKQALLTVLTCRRMVNSLSKVTPRSRTASTCWIILESTHSDTSCVAMSSSLCVIQTISVPSSQGWVGDALRHTIVECRWHTASGGQQRLVHERLVSTLSVVCHLRTDSSPVDSCWLGWLSPRCMPWTSWDLKLTSWDAAVNGLWLWLLLRWHRLSAFFQGGTTYTSQMLLRFQCTGPT